MDHLALSRRCPTGLGPSPDYAIGRGGVCAWRAGVGGDQAVVGRGGAVEAGDPSSDRRAWRHDHARVGGRSAAHLSAAHGGGVEAGSVQGVDLRAARAGSAAAVAAAARAGRGGRLWGGKTIFGDYVREVRPRFLVRRTFQRTLYRPGELVQCDLWEPREPAGSSSSPETPRPRACWSGRTGICGPTSCPADAPPTGSPFRPSWTRGARRPTLATAWLSRKVEAAGRYSNRTELREVIWRLHRRLGQRT